MSMAQTRELPELPPEPHSADVDEFSTTVVERAWHWHSIEPLLREYGEACYRAGMERGASVAAGLDCAHRCCVGSEVAAAIRAKAKPLEIPTDPQPIEQVPFRTPKGR
jgi:hypothetical protein